MTTYIVIQAIEVEAESYTDAVDRMCNQFEYPYFVHEKNRVNVAAVEVALFGAVEVLA